MYDNGQLEAERNGTEQHERRGRTRQEEEANKDNNDNMWLDSTKADKSRGVRHPPEGGHK